MQTLNIQSVAKLKNDLLMRKTQWKNQKTVKILLLRYGKKH